MPRGVRSLAPKLKTENLHLEHKYLRRTYPDSPNKMDCHLQHSSLVFSVGPWVHFLLSSMAASRWTNLDESNPKPLPNNNKQHMSPEQGSWRYSRRASGLAIQQRSWNVHSMFYMISCIFTMVKHKTILTCVVQKSINHHPRSTLRRQTRVKRSEPWLHLSSKEVRCLLYSRLIK